MTLTWWLIVRRVALRMVALHVASARWWSLRARRARRRIG